MEKKREMYAVRGRRMEKKEGRGAVSGDGETRGGEGGWMEGGREGGEREKGEVEEGGLDDKRKIQTGQSFLFANRAPDKDSACSRADRGAISLPYSLSPLLPPLPPSLRLAHPAVSLRGGEKEEKTKGPISAASWCYHQPATAQQLISLQLLLKGQGWDRTIMNTSSLPHQRN